MFSPPVVLRTYSSLMCNASVEFQIKIRKISRRRSRVPKHAEFSHFTKKCTKIFNARVQQLLCSLNLLFGSTLIAVAVVVCLSFLVTQ